MSDDDWTRTAELARQYLTSDERVRFLVRIAAALTITARECYLAGGGLREHAGTWLRCHNEVQHQLMNHLRQLLVHGRSTYGDDTFVDVLLNRGTAFGCHDAVRRAIDRAVRGMAASSPLPHAESNAST